jgi:pyocin large subunit-like protein
MEPIQRFTDEPKWTATEKKAARRAFDKAFERHCARISAEARQMLENATVPSDVWRVHDFLSKHRKTVDRIYDYRYSQLLLVFARLMRDGWLTEADLAGLQQEKIARIKRNADLLGY